MKLLSFDVESIGLHGEGFAVGWVAIEDGKEIASAFHACHPNRAEGTDSDREWVMLHVFPSLGPLTCYKPSDVRLVFWREWIEWRAKGFIAIADCGWPVETNFLSACIADHPGSEWSGPYPFMDVSTALWMTGRDPLASYARLPNELPIHHPTCDARQSARLFLEARGNVNPN